MDLTRENAWQTLTEHVQAASLRRHCLAVEASTAWYARSLGEDETLWRVTALLHDLTRKAQAGTKRLAGEPDGDLTLMRLHTRTKEYIIAPGETETLMIVQRSHSAALEPLVKVAEREQMAALAASAKGGDAAKKK